MTAFTCTRLTTTALALAMAATPASAQDVRAEPAAVTSPAIEVTPFVSIDSRGSIPVGVAVNFPLQPNVSIEAEVGYRRGEGGMNATQLRARISCTRCRSGPDDTVSRERGRDRQYGAPIVSGEGSVIGTQPRIAFEVDARRRPQDAGLGNVGDAHRRPLVQVIRQRCLGALARLPGHLVRSRKAVKMFRRASSRGSPFPASRHGGR